MTPSWIDANASRGPQPRPKVLRLHGRLRLPSVEAQTVAFVEYARQEREPMNAKTRWAGFSAYLRYARERRLTDSLVVGECLTIASVYIPDHLQHRGWFWRYCQMCQCLVNDALVLESVINVSLLKALGRRPEFLEFKPDSFLLRRTPDRPWPLSVFQTPP